MNNKIYVTADFEGANPRSDGIARISDDHFVLSVFSETTIESYRMETMIVNDSTEKQVLHIEINWPTKPFSELRDCFYVKHEHTPDWITAPAETAPGKSFLSIAALPGKTYLCLHPRYGYADCESFVSNLPYNGLISKELAGKSDKGRNIWIIKLSNGFESKEKLRFMISARNHANESSGNYCVEGMIEWLLSNEPTVPYFLEKIDFFFMPMTNPDGVAEGMARFTGTRCADLNRTDKWLRENTPGALPDRSHEAFLNALDSVKPTHFVNLHSYLFKYEDEIHARSEQDIESFTRFFPDDINAGKRWKHVIVSQDSPFPGFCGKNQPETLSLLLEIPWFGRNAELMKETGRKILRALILMNTATYTAG